MVAGATFSVLLSGPQPTIGTINPPTRRKRASGSEVAGDALQVVVIFIQKMLWLKGRLKRCEIPIGKTGSNLAFEDFVGSSRADAPE
mgnify:CR=1 FL=1